MKKIRESGSAGVKSTRKGVFEARLIDEGQGSSGYYTKELLKAYGPTTFSKNRPCFANHSTESEWENGRDLTKIMGKLVSDAEYREDADGKGALFAEVQVRPEWVDFVEEYMDVIGMSISVSGEASEREVDGEKRLVVESFDDTDPYRSVDFVVAAGRGGKVERMLESAKRIEEKTASSVRNMLQDALAKSFDNKWVYVDDFDEAQGIVYAETDEGLRAIEYTNDEHGKIVFGNAIEVRRETKYVPTNVQENLNKTTEKESGMDLEKFAEELNTKFDSLTETLNTLVAANAPAKTDEGEVDRADVVESAIEAGLSKTARARVLAAVEGGATPTDAIEAEKTLKLEYEAEFKESAKGSEAPAGGGRIVEGGSGERPLTEFKF